MDAVPPYWETTVHAPSNPNGDMIVDDLPTGSWFVFLVNVFISFFFQFVGFFFTYLLHTTHAAKYGSRVGLGLTLIQYGFYSRRQYSDEVGDILPGPAWNETMGAMTGMPNMDATMKDLMSTGNGTVPEGDFASYDLTSRDWVAFLLMTLGQSFPLPSSLVMFLHRRHDHRLVPPAFLTRWLLPRKTLGELVARGGQARVRNSTPRDRATTQHGACLPRDVPLPRGRRERRAARGGACADRDGGATGKRPARGGLALTAQGFFCIYLRRLFL